MLKQAKIIYQDADFKIIEPGDFVLCAVTKQKIPLNDLLYWSVDRQEAYLDCQISLNRELSFRI